MAKLTEVEGIGDVYAQKLMDAGIATTDALLEKGATPAGRRALVEASGISGTLILKFVNRVDLLRVKGIGEEYADLLEVSGVDTVPELAQRNASHLHQKMLEVNAEKNLVRQVPGQSQIENWIAQAKALDRVVTY